MDVSVICATARLEPQVDLLVQDLVAQSSPGDSVDLVVVDARARSPADLGIHCGSGAVHVRVFPPRPTPWRGEHRLTGRDYWAAASARNTGLVVCRYDYVAFVDDRSRLAHSWLAAVRDGWSSRDSVVAGTYEVLRDGQVHHDHRRRLYPGGLLGCGGGWLYGCSVAAPLAWLLEVNGFEEGCDGVDGGGEDYVLGLMLVNRGRRVDFDPRLAVAQDRSSASDHGLVRATPGQVMPPRALAALGRFGVRSRTELTPDLAQLRSSYVAGLGLPGVDYGADLVDWFDGRPISGM